LDLEWASLLDAATAAGQLTPGSRVQEGEAGCPVVRPMFPPESVGLQVGAMAEKWRCTQGSAGAMELEGLHWQREPAEERTTTPIVMVLV